MLSKGKTLFPKASHLEVHIIYTLHIFVKTLCFESFFEFFIYIIFYVHIVIFSILCFERTKVVKEM